MSKNLVLNLIDAISQVEKMMGTPKFLVLYFAAGLFGFILGANFALVGQPSVSHECRSISPGARETDRLMLRVCRLERVERSSELMLLYSSTLSLLLSSAIFQLIGL